jgi:glycosyltransferase involved in cell wall biosynthesis
MKLIINAESLAPPRTGIGLYTSNLLRQFSPRLPAADLQIFYQRKLWPAAEGLAHCDQLQADHSERHERIKTALYQLAGRTYLPYRYYQFRNQRAFRHHTRTVDAHTLYHEPNFIVKPFDGPAVTTVHDLSFLHYPEFHPAARVRFLERHLPASLHRADHVITVSELVRQELIETFNLAADKVSAIHLGVADGFHQPDPDQMADTLARYDLNADRYLLCVATLEPRKNLVTLIEAWKGLPDAIRQHYPLIIAGSRGWHTGQIDQLLRQSQGGIRFLGYVPRADLAGLYGGATVFAFPSVYEGFGLPVLEAMASGAAVLTGQDTAMAEFAGTAVAVTDVGQPQSLRAAIEALIEDNPTRLALKQAGQARARELTWEACADKHWAIYRQLVDSH